MNLWKQKSDDNFPQIWSLAEMYISVGAKSELAGEAEPNQFSTNSAWTSQYFSKFYIFQSCILSLVVQSDTSSIFHRKSEYNSSSRRCKIAWANFSKTKSPTGRRWSSQNFQRYDAQGFFNAGGRRGTIFDVFNCESWLHVWILYPSLSFQQYLEYKEHIVVSQFQQN